MDAVITETTCNEACWRAREESCHCSCGGRNHGCLRVTEDGQVVERPARQMRRAGFVYELHSIHKTNSAAWGVVSSATSHANAFLRHLPQPSWQPRKGVTGQYAFDERALPSQMKWAELQPFIDEQHRWFRPFLAWVRVDVIESFRQDETSNLVAKAMEDQ